MFLAALRQHQRRPAFAVASVLAVGFAIAINVTVFAALDAVRTPEFAVESPDRLVVPEIFPSKPAPATAQLFARGVEDGVPSFEQSARLYWDGSRELAESDQNVQDVYVFSVSDNFFSVLRPGFVAGRALSSADRAVGVDMVVITRTVEQALFPTGGSAIGRDIKLASKIVRVVGVIPKRAAYPEFADVYRLGAPPYALGQVVLSRAKPGVGDGQIRNDLALIRARVDPPGTVPRTESRVELTHAFRASSSLKDFHWAMLLGAVAVLLIACFNVANLQVARSFDRTTELAVRAAIGASSRQLFLMLLTEMAVIAVAGTAIGLLLGVWGVTLFGSSVPLLGERSLVPPQWSWRVFAATALAATTSMVVAGLAAAATASRVRSTSVLRSGAGAGVPRSERIVGSALLVAQIALSLALCIHSALLTRTAIKLQRLDMGFETSRLITGSVALRTDQVNGNRTRVSYARELAQRLKALPDAAEASVNVVVALPVDGVITVATNAGSRENPMPRWAFRSVTPAYFRTLGVRPIRGRDFEESGEGVASAIVNEQAVRQWFAGMDPLGQMLKAGPATSTAPWVRVIGVVPNVRLQPTLEDQPAPLLVISHSFDATPVGRDPFLNMSFIARTKGNAAQLALQVLQLSEGDAGPGRRTWASTWERSRNLETIRARERFVASVFWTFTLLAVGLATMGVYSTMSYTASRRTAEYGIRLALGASPHRILIDRLREGNILAMLGIVGGLMLARWSVDLLNAFLLGLEPFEPLLFAGVAVALQIVVVLAVLPSALRSRAVSPSAALRSQ